MSSFLRGLAAILGGLIGLLVCNIALEHPDIMQFVPIKNELILYSISVIFFAIILFLLYPFITRVLRGFTNRLEQSMRHTNLFSVSLQIIGLIIGLLLAALISSAFSNFPIVSVRWVITICIYLILGYIGWALPQTRTNEVMTMFNKFRKSREQQVSKKIPKRMEVNQAKLLDTSVIIDGRIADIFKTHFIEGDLIIPVYVLSELQLISDSADDLKRGKGRRGLDIVAQLQEEFPNQIKILEEDYTDIKEVDQKLIKTAKEKDYKIITNDYNLNKLASVQGVEILNINDLANAVKLIVLPGEKISVTLLKAGKEPGQAIAYLDDGTMIVVEHGRHLIGKTLSIIVTSVLQTSAGRMIFAKPQEEKYAEAS